MLAPGLDMATVAEQLVGRAGEIGVLERALTALKAGGPSATAVIGEPGIGKTRLLSELAGRADQRGCIVLSGSGSEFEQDLPFWVFVDALDEYVAGLEPRRLESLEDGVRGDLAGLLPSLSEYAGEGPSAPQDQRYRAHRAVGELLQRLAATKPLVLVLDDVHWADSASIDLLGALLRRPPAAPVLLALGARPRQMPERLTSALERANRAGGLTLLELGALKREEAAQLLGEGTSAAFADELYRQSGGNPFYLEELARSLDRGDRPSMTGADLSLTGVDVPRAVAAALTEELALLPDTSRRLFEGAAVVGDPFEPELAAAAAAIDDAAAIEALDDLLSRDLVRPTDVPRRFRFRHPLVRTVVYETAPGGWVLGAHERCANALAERGAAAAVRAHHVEHAASPGDVEAMAVLREAGGAAMVSAPASAARWFGAALRVLQDDAPPEERLGLLMARSAALAASGQLEESRATLLDTLVLVPEDAVETWVQLTVACAGVEHFLGRHDLARKRLAEALDRLPDRATPEGVALMLELAVDGMFSADYVATSRWGARALEAARPLGDMPLVATAGAIFMLGSTCSGEVAEAQSMLAEVEALVDGMSDDELARRPDAAGYLGAAELHLDRFADAIAHAERGLEIARATGQMVPTVVPTLGTARYMHGLLAESAAVLDIGLETARIGGVEQAIAWSLVNRSQSALVAGDVETALSTAEEANELTQGLDESWISGWAGVAHAGALLASDEPARAVESLLSAAGGEEVRSIPGGWKAMTLDLLTRCRLALGERDAARASAERAVAVAASVPLPMTAAWAERATAAVALDAGDTGMAAEAALRAAARADSAGAPIEAAVSRVLAGRALAEAGDRERAVAELERAAAAFEAGGATPCRDATERELRKLGRVVHRRTRKGTSDNEALADLSQRELEVARLVVDRKTNKEIAAELFVSVKTVEAHMRNLFRKLSVSSRAEVARTVERADRNQGSG
jgi:ATP/maltotriose-dependent transcriptional regulator MalT